MKTTLIIKILKYDYHRFRQTFVGSISSTNNGIHANDKLRLQISIIWGLEFNIIAHRWRHRHSISLINVHEPTVHVFIQFQGIYRKKWKVIRIWRLLIIFFVILYAKRYRQKLPPKIKMSGAIYCLYNSELPRLLFDFHIFPTIY